MGAADLDDPSSRSKSTKKTRKKTSVEASKLSNAVDSHGENRSKTLEKVNKNNLSARFSSPAIVGSNGGFWQYFVNRKREKTNNQQRLYSNNNKHHSSGTFGVDRRREDPAPWLVGTQTETTLAAAASSMMNSASSSSFSPSLASWMNHAWQTVDSAREWMMMHTTSSPANVYGDLAKRDINDDILPNEVPYENSNLWTTITTISLPSYIASLNPFLDKNDHRNGLHSSSPLPLSTSKAYKPKASSAFSLPKFASRFEWATRQRNPYQAVTGRNVYFAEREWSNWLQLPHWLNVNEQYYTYDAVSTNSTKINVKRERDEHDTSHQLFVQDNSIINDNDIVATEKQQNHRSSHGSKRPKRNSRTSDASLQAVKDLLLLVRQQVEAMELEEENIRREEKVTKAHALTTHQHRNNVQPSIPSSVLQSMAQSASSSLQYCSLSPQPTSSSPLILEHALSSSLPIIMPSKPQLFKGDSFDSEDGLSTMRSSPVRASFLVDSNITTEEIQSEGNTLDRQQAMKAEMASLLAEGTLRAYRDLALDEATELRSALHHWTVRWERPFLGWLEAGPDAWLVSEEEIQGRCYSSRPPPHLVAGKKVSQIQVVLARRCAVIGELQQHLWRASWQKGVAGWGMLGGGVGGEWTSVVGEFGGIESSLPSSTVPSRFPSSAHTQERTIAKKQQLMKIFKHSNLIGSNVSNLPGGSRCIDDSLTKWCIDAMRIIRDQLYRVMPASKNEIELPYVEHWPRERNHFRGKGNSSNDEMIDLPCWAEYLSPAAVKDAATLSCASLAAADAVREEHESSVIIADLGKMADEVNATLQSIEVLLEQQRARRLDHLRPPSRLRRNWYIVAAGVPVGAYMLYKLTKEHGWLFLLNTLLTKTADICRDHVFEPLHSIYKELFTKTGRIDITDRKARVDAIESLKRMIRSWLEESFPKMPIEEMIERADNMDISLIEEKMEESIKHIYELNSVVRMSLIEMQFIKKELLNALVQIDELMGSNEINMRIAAMTPAVLLLFAIRRVFQLLFYALFKMGKTKEEIHASFRQIILDIERLLLMRDCPPPPPDALDWGSKRMEAIHGSTANSITQKERTQTLSAEDLGMLLLHIHECRNILWESRRRFRDEELRNIAEDLAELAGERGPVSVAQQLQIISRMSRTYPFMKVVSSGLPFPAFGAV